MKTAGPFVDELRVVRIDKVSGIGFIDALAEVWRAGAIAMPLDPHWPLPEIGVQILQHIEVIPSGGWLRPSLPDCDPASPALIALTSGTTAAPKAILLSHGALDDVTRRLVEVMDLDSSIREYVGVPVTYSFGAGRVRAISKVGGQAFIPEAGFRPDAIASMLASAEINAISAVPSMFRLLLARPDIFRDAAENLRWIEIGSQYMAAAEKLALRELFPNARIIQHYGLTEASRSTFLIVSETEERTLETVGQATGDVQIRVDREGEVSVRGPHVAMGRIVDGDLQRLTDEDGWLRTADLGRIDGGYLTYLGRSDQVANIAGIKVSADHFEQKLLERLCWQNDALAVGIKADPVRGQRLLVAVTPKSDRKQAEALGRALAAEHGLGAADLSFATVGVIPRTDTGKVQRNRLAELVDEPVPTIVQEDGSALSSSEGRLAAIWGEILGISDIGPNETFFDVGGDSLSAVSVALRAEQAGLSSNILHRMFEGRTLREIVAEDQFGAKPEVTSATRRAQLSTSINATRGLLVLAVIGAHWLPFFYDRMGHLGSSLRNWLEPAFHIGTPGFAIVFGIGLVIFYRPLMERSAASFRRKLISNTKFLAAGVILQGGVLLMDLLLREGQLSPIYPERMFYSVLLFYLLMIPTAGLWLRVIYSGSAPALNALLVAVAAASASALLQNVWPLAGGDGWVRLAQHMLVAPYSYPLLLGAVCVGASIGVWMMEHQDDVELGRTTAKVGLVLLSSGAIAVGLFTPGWWSLAQTPAAFPAYAGGVALGIACMTTLIKRDVLRTPVRVLAAVGLLAFPAFVAHGMVIPFVQILQVLALPYPAALGIPVALFLVAAFLATRKFYRMLFEQSDRREPVINQSLV